MASIQPDSVVVVQTTFPLRLRRRQVVLVLAGFPALYLVNNFLPWSLGLYGSGDRNWYLPFMASVFTLHWLTTAWMVAMVYRAGGNLEGLGLKMTPLRVAIALAVLAAWGGLLLACRNTWPIPAEHPTGWQIIYPFTWTERIVMLGMSFTAGVCEELLYRGFAIRVLRGRGMALWLALLLGGLSFAVIHGIAGLLLLPMYLIVHLLFAAIFLWRKSLWPAIYLHVMWDMMMVLAV